MNLKDFYEVIPKLPGVRVYQFSDSFESSQDLSDFAKIKDFELEIVTFNDDIFNKLKELKDENIRVRKIDEDKERYNLRQAQYDTVFVNLDIRKLKNLEEFLRKIYRMMKNAANIVLPVKAEDKDMIRDLLGKCNYVAINDTELDKERIVFIAKKLHGWEKV